MARSIKYDFLKNSHICDIVKFKGDWHSAIIRSPSVSEDVQYLANTSIEN